MLSVCSPVGQSVREMNHTILGCANGIFELIFEDAEQGLFACYRIDIDAVAGEPSEKLWFTGHC